MRNTDLFEYYAIAVVKGSPLHKRILDEARLRGCTNRIAPMLRSRLESSYEQDDIVDKIIGRLSSISVTIPSSDDIKVIDNLDEALDIWSE